jgi:hypothetical protein
MTSAWTPNSRVEQMFRQPTASAAATCRTLSTHRPQQAI